MKKFKKSGQNCQIEQLNWDTKESELVRVAVEESKKAGMSWLYVYYKPEYKDFYQRCGSRHTEAGLIKLK